MKKILVIIIILAVFSVVNIKSQNNYNYLLNEDSYYTYKIKINNLNTKNILNCCDKLNIVNIYPSINPIYKEKIGNIVYNVKSNNIKDEIENFKDSYLNLIKKNNYADYNYLYINGINIEAIDVYMNSRELYSFLVNNNANVVDKINH